MFRLVFTRPVEFISGLLMVLITLIIFLQVVTRYVFQHPFDWPEELARYLFVWLALFGASLALHRGVHFSIDYFTKKCSPRTKFTLSISTNVGLGIFVLLIAVKGLELALRVKEQVSPGMEISMSYPYLSIPVSFTIMFIYSVHAVYGQIRALKGKE